MTRSLSRLFTEHPQSVDENYFEHLLFAGRFAAKLLVAGLAALVHAILPFLFEKTASRMINDMHYPAYPRWVDIVRLMDSGLFIQIKALGG